SRGPFAGAGVGGTGVLHHRYQDPRCLPRASVPPHPAHLTRTRIRSRTPRTADTMPRMAFPADVPVLSDGVVTLRAHRDGDVDAMVEMCRDPEFIAWTSVPTPYNRDMARGFIEDVVRPGWDRHNHRSWA